MMRCHAAAWPVVSALVLAPACTAEPTSHEKAEKSVAVTPTEKAIAETADQKVVAEDEAPVRPRFRLKLRTDPCALLTEAMVAKVAGVEESAFNVSSERADMCRYDWDGGRATIGTIRVSKNAEIASQHFDVAYGGAGSEKTPFELVEAVGDAAAWDEKELKARVSNAIFTVTYSGKDEGRSYRDEAIALAKLIVTDLP